MNQSLLQRQYSTVEDTAPLYLWPDSSPAEIEIAIRAIYRQVLGNMHMMESEALTVPESKLRNGEISIREFVRKVANSDLYRANFFESCPRYRSIELNFKHLLGRAPSDYTEMKAHSQILDTQGYEADIDSYLDSDEYLDAFGDWVVPYYRGHKTETGVKQVEFNYMLELAASSSGSDRETSKPQLQKALISNYLSGQQQGGTDTARLLANLFATKPKAETPSESVPAEQSETDRALQDRCQEQEELLQRLQQQLADLKPFGAIGAATVGQWSSNLGSDRATTQSESEADNRGDLQKRADAQAAEIKALQEKIADERRYASIGEARVNRWRSRNFSR